MSDAPHSAAAATAPKPGKAIFEADSVVKRFGGIRAVNGASMKVGEGSITALIGPNGAGKTTFFNVITGFYRADGGRATFAGDAILGHQPYSIARRGMVRTFQITKALAAMPVLDNMTLAAPDQPGEKLRNLVFRPGASRRREREVHAEAMELLEVFNLTKLAGAYAGTLSGGQRKLLELARALMTKPRFLLLDEPAAGLNEQESDELVASLSLIRDDFSCALMVIEHDMRVIMRLCERIQVLDYGKTISIGTPAEVRQDPAVLIAYLGRRAVDAGDR